ncbi:MAG: hypothetical protein NDJ89_14340 [Oligoflexia bacterium]|nr:hypothetical protein [Oligoflexia bacterium]
MNQDKANFYYFALINVTALAVALSGCATSSKSIGLGGAIGTGTGAVLGGIADPGKNGELRTRNVIVGSALGGMAGMIAGSVIHENTEEQKREAFLKGQASAPQPKPGAMPALKSPKVETHWVEGRIVGNRFIEGHFEYIISEPARWEEK